MFRSKLEEKVSALLVELNVGAEYEAGTIDYVIKHKYLPDFRLPNGVHLECKGYWDDEDRRKVRNVKEQNPDLDLRMVFQNPYNTINKRSKTTYAQYCERIGIPWCSYNSIPLKWLT